MPMPAVDPEIPDRLRTLAEEGIKRRLEHLQERQSELSREEKQALKRSIPLPLPLVLAGVFFFVLACFTSVLVSLMSGSMLPFLGLGALLIGGLYAAREHHQRLCADVFAWPDTLPFPVEGYRRWFLELLTGDTGLVIVFYCPPDRELVEDVISALLPEGQPRWLTETTLLLALPQTEMRESTSRGRISVYRPNLHLLQILVDQALSPLHEEFPIARLRINGTGPHASEAEYAQQALEDDEDAAPCS